MSTLKYIGRPQDSDGSLVHKQYVDTRYAQISVDQAFVDSTGNAIASTLVNQAYVDAGDATRAKIAAVDASDANYILATQRGLNNGIAPIGADGTIPAIHYPADIKTDRAVGFANVSSILLSSRTVLTTTTKEYQAAIMEIADPGFPYIPMVFGSVRGQCGTKQPQNRRMGNGSIGKMVVLSQSDQVWGAGLATGSFRPQDNIIRPYGAPGQTPGTTTPMTGANTLSIWLSLWKGSTYTFTSENLSFYALLFSAV